MEFLGSFAYLGDALIAAFTLRTMLILFLGTALGVVIGCLPGLTATMGVALVTGLTFGSSMSDTLAVLIAIYIGAIYGGSRSAILINIPGTPAAAATTLDGYVMAKNGEALRALTVATQASFIGTVFGVILLFFISPLLVKIALKFGAYEYFLLALFGIVISGSLTSDQPIKGWMAGCAGLLVSTIGIEQMQGVHRYTFGNVQLAGGIELIPAMIGVFGIPEVIMTLQNPATVKIIRHIKSSMKDQFKYIIETSMHIKAILRAGAIGSFIGAIPGVGADVACWVAYDAQKRADKRPKYGEGAIEGIIAPEVANNAVIGGAFIPMLSLAVPGDAVTAVILGAFWLHGVRPGPLLMFEMPEVYYSVVALSLYGAVFMLIVGLLLTPLLVRILAIAKGQLMPIVAALSIVGSFAINSKLFDITIMLIFGFIGYFMRKGDFPAAPLILGIILGPMADASLRRALMLSNGSITPFFQRPISIIMILLILILFVSSIYSNMKKEGGSIVG